MAQHTLILANYSDVENIGTVVTDTSAENSAVPVQSNGSQGTAIASVALSAGTWVITGGVRFPGNSTGIRRIMISTSSQSSSISPKDSAQASVVGSGTESLTKTIIIPQSSAHTYYLCALQNSGSSLSCYGYLRAVRIK